MTAPGFSGERVNLRIMTRKSVHWADRLAENWLRKRGNKHLVEIGVSPSGPIHIGFLRELVLGDVLTRVLRDAGAEVRFILFADSMDPLRRRYPFLDESYEEHVGKPLCNIPAPWGECSNFAETFLNSFNPSLKKLGIELEMVRSEDQYRSGFFTREISLALEHQKKIADIIREESGRQMDDNWVPVNPLCSQCGKLTATRVLDYDLSSTTIHYACQCGQEGTADYSKGEAKLPWRIDWPARWSAYPVTVEPFGKDHASPGGSYATGRRICEEVFGVPAPEPVPYEWINLKGQGAMSKSKGIGVTIEDMVDVVPPEVLRYLILRDRPNQAIDFDPSRKLIQIVDEFESLERRILQPESSTEAVSDVNRRSYQLARIHPEQIRTPVEIPFRQLTTLVQVAAGDEEILRSVLQRTGYGEELQRWEQVRELAEYAWQWANEFAPEDERMHLATEMPPAVSSLSPEQILLLEKLADYLDGSPSADEIHQQIYTDATELGLQGPDAFRAIYIALIGKEKGPRAGFFLASLDRDFVQNRFRNVRTSVI